MSDHQYKDNANVVFPFQNEAGDGGGSQKRPVTGLPSVVVGYLSNASTKLTAILSALTGIATSAKQDTGNGSLASILSALGAALTVNLPTGASTAANQVSLRTDVNPSTAGTPFQLSTGITATQLTSSVTANGIWVKNISTLAQLVCVGRSGVTTSTGYQLAVGEERWFPCRNANEWYIIASAVSANVCVEPI